jgi:hypothetical protein
MNSDTQLKLISAIHTHFQELKLSTLCVDMCEYCLGFRETKPQPVSFHKTYEPSAYLINNFQDALRRKLPHVYSTIFP